jgi:Family of unknown function (DUF6498)
VTATRPAPSLIERSFDLYRQTASSRATIALVAANAVPLVGVLFFGWSLWTILAIYWVENGIVGLWNIPKILMAGGVLLPGRTGVGYRAWAVQPMPAGGRGVLAAFFAIHYGLFWLVHGVFVVVLPSFLGVGRAFGTGFGDGLAIDPGGGVAFPGSGGSPFLPGAGSSVGAFGVLDWSAVATAGIVLFVSHGVTFFVDYLAKGEYRTRIAALQMFAPYGRMVVLHLTILFGAFAIAFLGAPIFLLVILVIGKTLLDLGLHLRQSPLPAAPAPVAG